MTEQSRSTLPAAVDFGDQSLTIIDHAGTPWLSAADLARALGYKRADFVAQLYRKHADEFTAGMSENVDSTLPGNLRTQQRIFSPRGCHLIAMFARTPRAAAFRRWVLDVLEGLAAPRGAEPLVSDRFADAEHRLRCWSRAMAAGKPAPEVPEELVDGVMADLLWGRRYVVSFDSRLNTVLRALPADAILIEPEHLAELIEDPGSKFRRPMLANIIAAAARRLAGLPCQGGHPATKDAA